MSLETQGQKGWLRRVYTFFTSLEKTSLVLYGLALCTRLGYVGYLFFLGGVSLIGGADNSQYMALAHNVVTNHAFSLSAFAPFIPDGLRTPGYPLFLAGSLIVTGGFFFAAIVQAFLGAFIPVLVRKIGLTIGISSRASTIAATIGIVDLNLLSNTASFQTESLFMPLFLWFVLYTLQSFRTFSMRHAIVLGVMCGVLALIRPVFLYVGFGLLLVMVVLNFLSMKKAISYGLVSLLFMGLTISPWLIRNQQHFGSYELASIGPVNMYTRLAVSVLAVRDGIPFLTSYKSALKELAVAKQIPDLDYPKDEAALYDIRYNALFNKESLRIVRENPEAFLKLQANSVFAILTHDNTLNILQAMQIAPASAYPSFSVSLLFLTAPFGEFIAQVSGLIKGWYILPFIGRAFWIAVMFGAFAGAYTLFRRSMRGSPEQSGLLLIVYCIGAFIVVTLPIAFSIDARMRVPIEPFLLLLACHTYLSLLSNESVKKWYSKRVLKTTNYVPAISK